MASAVAQVLCDCGLVLPCFYALNRVTAGVLHQLLDVREGAWRGSGHTLLEDQPERLTPTNRVQHSSH